MAPPALMSSNDWLRKTNRKRTFSKSDKVRSDPLLIVDSLVDSYERLPTPDTLETLDELLTAWMNGKMKRGVLTTIRDHLHAVTDLERQLTLALTLLTPVEFHRGYPGIFIAQDSYRGNHWVPDDFEGTVNTALQQIDSQPVGRTLLTRLSAGCNRVAGRKVVIEYSGGGSMAAPLDVVTNTSRKTIQRTGQHGTPLLIQEVMANPNLVATQAGVMTDGRRKQFINGAGTGAVVTWNHRDVGQDGRPGFIALAHELVHALHYVEGSCYRAATGSVTDQGNSGIMEEEMRTVGCLRYAGESPSENAIRGEHNVPLRANYSATMSFANVEATAFV